SSVTVSGDLQISAGVDLHGLSARTVRATAGRDVGAVVATDVYALHAGRDIYKVTAGNNIYAIDAGGELGGYGAMFIGGITPYTLGLGSVSAAHNIWSISAGSISVPISSGTASTET